MDVNRFYESMTSESTLVVNEIEAVGFLAEKYPYFQHAIFLYLQALYRFDYEKYKVELGRLSINVRDRKALFYFIFSEEFGELLNRTGGDTISEDKTAVLLNAFFADSAADGGNLAESVVIDASLATSDYLCFLSLGEEYVADDKSEGDAPRMKYQGLIDNFMQRSRSGDIQIKLDREAARSSVKEVYSEDNTDSDDESLSHDIFFTETLAKIYIKQKRYEKAYKIIKHLSLNYPKKNAYFADQLNFLEKLIINSKYKDKK